MSAGPGGATLRPLTHSDAAALASFRCKGYRQPWTEALETAIRERLAGALRLRSVSALGLWCESTLVGIAVWGISSAPSVICQCHFVAVSTGHQRKGFGRLLKEAVIGQARDAGACAITSFVHRDNEAMLRLNTQLGATVEAIPGDTEYCLCTIPLT